MVDDTPKKDENSTDEVIDNLVKILKTTTQKEEKEKQTKDGSRTNAFYISLLIFINIIGVFFLFQGAVLVTLILFIVSLFIGARLGYPILTFIAGVIISIFYGFTTLPYSTLFALVGMTIMWGMAILSIPYEKRHILYIASFASIFIFSIIWVKNGLYSLYTIGIFSGFILIFIGFKEEKHKLYYMLGGFTPLIIFGIYITIIFISSGITIGIQRLQHFLFGETQTKPTIFSLIFNPEELIKAQLKPPTTKEVTEEKVSSVAFSASGSTFPDIGCYDSTTFQVIGTVKNVGNEILKDVSLFIRESPDNIDVCRSVLRNCEYTGGKRLGIIPKGVQKSGSCLAGPVEESLSKSVICYIDILAETGYVSTTRLSVEFLDKNYGSLKANLNQLNLNVKPSTVSLSPVEFSIGGFQQPVITYDNYITMITTISNNAKGDVVNYYGAFLFIPNDLLRDGQCIDDNDDWYCIDKNTFSSYVSLFKNALNLDIPNAISNQVVLDYLRNYIDYYYDNDIGGYSQFNYDNLASLLNEDYSLCIYKNDMDTNSLVISGTCTLRPPELNTLRKTYLIIGDVLYTYRVKGETSFGVRACK